MNCPKCSEAVGADARFCGNCGQSLVGVPVSEAVLPVPAYASASPVQEKAEAQAMAALLVAVLSVPGAIIAMLGLALGLIALVLATSSRAMLGRKAVGNVAIGFAVLGIILSVASAIFGYTYVDQQTAAASQDAAGDVVVEELPAVGLVDNACYSVTMPEPAIQVVEATAGSCNVQARDDQDFDMADEFFGVNAAKNDQVTSANFADTARQVVERNADLLLPGFSIVSRQEATFAGGPAYLVDAQAEGGRTVQLAVIYRPVSHGENVFVIAHGNNRGAADVMQFQKQWEWKQ